MERQRPVDDVDRPGKRAEPINGESAFSATWKATDAALLQPSNLSVPGKIRRAWERKPLSPFSKQRLRIGKVWKRTGLGKMVPETLQAERHAVQTKGRSSLQGPLKPVKKMRLATEFGLGARVLQWEGAESPVRKIVTRSQATSDNIVALPEEENEEAQIGADDGDVVVQILEEDGTLLDIWGAELANDQEWEDETISATADGIEASDDSSMSVNDAEESSSSSMLDTIAAHTQLDPSSNMTAVKELAVTVAEIQGSSDESNRSPIVSTVSSQHHVLEPTNQIVLPDGFVSPIRPVRRRAARRSMTSRRRTLPVQFAPATIAEAMLPTAESASPDKMDHDDMTVSRETTVTLADADPTTEELYDAQGRPEGEWEDLNDEANVLADDKISTHIDDGVEDHNPTSSSAEAAEEAMYEDLDASAGLEGIDDMSVPEDMSRVTKARLPASPIHSIPGEHIRLPLRRSPRRKSSSPVKQSSILPSMERSHLIAFTPLKAQSTFPSTASQSGFSFVFTGVNGFTEDDMSPPERSASAPPEEPQMSPQKPMRPRVSDDTALLQAFLNRAAESKSSRRASTSKRESMSNRRDSGAVRQALASPVKQDVLGDLDPNSPSPRKSSTLLDPIEVLAEPDLQPDTVQEEQLEDEQSGPTTRRGDRASRRMQPTIPGAPSKISIRATAEGVFLKRSEAQELANITRTNTRKNKAGAVLPSFRLAKLGPAAVYTSEEAQASDAEEATRNDAVQGKRRIAWAEVLVEFYQGGEVSETSSLSEELEPPAKQSEAPDVEVAIASDAPPPAETPSKPKIRRLKPPRTAATPAKPPPAPLTKMNETATAVVQQESSASLTRRRSRIATPAKGLTNASLLPADLTPGTQQPGASAAKNLAPKRRAPISKLPAPANALAPANGPTHPVSSALGQGKEKLISSPPKKRANSAGKMAGSKLDFGIKTQLQPSQGATVDNTGPITVPGLMSPAKKAKGRSVLFGSMAAPDFGLDNKDELPGLSSPAKKRARRAMGS